ncbi:DUF6870 family protein [Mediterraneibacter faecis]
MTLETMKKLTPEDVELSSLVDIGTIRIDPSLPSRDKFSSYLEQIKNPYLFRCGDVIVKVSYSDTSISLEDRLEQFIRQRSIAERNSF